MLQVGDSETPITTNEGKLRRTMFSRLEPDVEYQIRACTVINGRAIARRIEKVPSIQKDGTVIENM